jgi:hypothetical protein
MSEGGELVHFHDWRAARGRKAATTSRTWRSMGWPVKSSIPRKGSFTSRWHALPYSPDCNRSD